MKEAISQLVQDAAARTRKEVCYASTALSSALFPVLVELV